ncbi:VCBS repeat-containing protein [Algoriphagus sp. CAU 1675]|uniref:VCBS repeat-containing protein n=1 Tax=Algoriphagus sp. CAU 1675 TaxID=3032597 RepID=UPI0023DB1985|nr:VCBS repeat-containing protein [Algoriphagus sp. CAU 1675]MDF2158294.1 VCBS repeat-containing protein [Algoriphagus sp. CAU 1675]
MIAQKSFSGEFERVSNRKSGINFKNQLLENEENNILRYEYFYNGGGVAIGDLDNDGLDDVFLTGNMVSNRLYKNLGALKFEDKTKDAKIEGKKSWTTGVSLADVNSDGLLDIYVCYSGKENSESRKNELWINLGNFSFEEKAEEYGLADPSNSTQALFFDYDRDGDLDMYLLNHHIQVINELEFDEVKGIRHPTSGDKLYRNDGEKFTDVSQQAGIKGSALGFGLSVIASDVNGDGWPDLLVTNDYIEPDYLYINQKNGTFLDEMQNHFNHISHFSMGADIADINNDGLLDIYTLDMLPENNERQKLLYGPENYEQYALMIQKGFYHQNMRNMLQLNVGGDNFSEIGQLSGISNTDWSWSALFFDMTNDGNKDLMVTNGYYRDYTNRDFLKYKGDYYFKQAVANEKADTLHLVTSMTSTPIRNYLFENKGNLKFEDRSEAWGFDSPVFSNGAAYSDLDNDGDLDLIINNLNEAAGIFENKGTKGNWIQVNLKGPSSNPFGIGAKIQLRSGGITQFVEHYPVRGFQSSSTYRVHLGIGRNSSIDSLTITWPDGSNQIIKKLNINSINNIEYSSDSKFSVRTISQNPILKKSELTVPYLPHATGFNDFKRQPLMISMPSAISPVLAQADLNQDGNPEIFIGGTKGKKGGIFSFDGTNWTNYSGFNSSDEFTDAVAIFEDFNGDGAVDLFIGSGGFHDYISSDESLSDRLYWNDGNGKLTRSRNFPAYTISTGAAVILDANGDGHPDLFVGGKVVPGRYPQIPDSKLLINDGTGNFTDQSESYLPENGKIGMITASVAQDLNGDGLDDLVIVGEFLPITFLINQEGQKLTDQTEYYISNQLSGWWSSLAQADMDQDGDLDLIAGNFGENSQFKASDEKLLKLYAADFDQNGSIDPILECFIGGQAYPFPSRDELLDQMVSMRSKFTDYASYASAKMGDLFSEEELQNAQLLEANTLESYYLENTPNGFIPHKLPVLAQSFPLFSILPLDLNQDGNMDLVLGGNQRNTRIRIGNIDAGLGLVLLGDGNGNFKTLYSNESGLSIKGDIKSVLPISIGQKNHLLFGIHGQALELYTIHDN